MNATDKKPAIPQSTSLGAQVSRTEVERALTHRLDFTPAPEQVERILRDGIIPGSDLYEKAAALAGAEVRNQRHELPLRAGGGAGIGLRNAVKGPDDRYITFKGQRVDWPCT